MKLCCSRTDHPETIELPAESTVENTRENFYGEDEAEISNDFPEIDHISLYTMRICMILSIPQLLSAAYTLSYVFTTGTVSYRCLVTECEDPADTSLYPSWLSNAVPFTNDIPSTCTRYSVQNSSDSCSTTVFTHEVKSCDAWVYDPEETTILNEWDLTCDNNLWKLTLPGTINNVGQFIGLTFAGYLSDKYGRRNVLTIFTLISSIFGLCRAFSINYSMFVTFEFLDALGGAAIYSAGFVLGMEFVGPKKRVLLSNVICCMYAFGEVMLALFAMWLRSWRYLILVFYAPGLLAIFIPYLVPESVRWLLSKGRVTEAETLLRKLASHNQVEVSQKSIQLIRNSNKGIRTETEESDSLQMSPMRQVFANRIILLRLIICACCWVANTFVYYGLSLRSVTVSGDKYVNFILVALVEIPGQLTSWILVDYVGRKPTLSIAFLFSGLFCIVTIFVPEDISYLPLIVFLGGKFSITIAFSAIYVFTAEMFPTSLRNTLLGFCSMTARIGSMLAPQMPLLEVYMPSLPMLLFGIVAIAASILSLHFPETVGTKLPDTMDEATNIKKLKKVTKSGSKIFCAGT